MPKPICEPFSGSINPNNLVLGYPVLITIPMVAGTTYSIATGQILDNVDVLAFASDGLELAGPLTADPAHPTTHFVITPAINYLANTVTVRVFGSLPLSVSNSDITLGGRYVINQDMTAGTTYTLQHPFSVSDANFIAFGADGIEIPACKISRNMALPLTHFDITPGINYLAGAVTIRVLGNT